MNFLPDDYQAPKSSNHYMKINEGENRIRILSQPIFGWEDWHDKKPVRFRYNDKPAKSYDPKKPIRHFWSFIVFNYAEEQIQVLHITQATIRKSVEALCRDKDWGSPYAYDIKICKTGEGVDTEYTVNPTPHKPIDPYLIQMFKEKPCNLDAIFTNSDPFSGEWVKYTPIACNVEPNSTEKTSISPKDIAELKKWFSECAMGYQTQLLATLAKLPTPVKNIEDVPAQIFEKVKIAVKKKRDECQAMFEETENLFAVG